MNIRTFFLSAALLAAGIVRAQSVDDSHVFTDLTGRTVRARIVDFDSSESKFLLEANAGPRVWALANAFVPDDQKYLKGWLASYLGLSRPALDVAIRPHEGPWQSALPGGAARRETSAYSSSISVKKNTDVQINDFRIEYRYFVLKTEITTEIQRTSVTNVDTTVAHETNVSVTVSEQLVTVTNEVVSRQVGGEFVIGNMVSGQSLTFNLGAVNLMKEYDLKEEVTLFGISYREALARYERVLGVWVRVSGCSPDGVVAVREICTPKDLRKKVDWSQEVPMLTTAGSPPG